VRRRERSSSGGATLVGSIAGSPGFHESKYTSTAYAEYLRELEQYFLNSKWSTLEKLENFPKYVPRGNIARFLARYEIFKEIVTVQGSIVECGVLYGGGLMAWAQLSTIFEPANHQRNVIGFDTFAGFSKISEKDQGGTSDFLTEGGLSVDSHQDLMECIRLFDMTRFMNHIDKVRLVRGDITVTVPQFLEQNPHTVVSLLYLDVDVFEPTAAAIKHLRPRMPKGSVIAFDELNAPNWPGETMAVLQELDISTLSIRRFPFGTSISYAVLE